MGLEAPFASGDSDLHRLDPRIKVVAAAGLSVATAVVSNVLLAASALAASGCLVFCGGLRLRAVLKRLLPANILIAAMWLFLPWAVPGRALWNAGPMTVTHEGVALAALITVKCNAILLALVALLSTSSLADVASALGRLGVPNRLTMVLFFCVRYVSVIEAERGRLTQAMTVRAFRPRPSLRTYTTYAYMLGTLAVRTHDRAQRIYQAMLCRGFEGTFPVVRRPRPGRRDIVFGATLLAFSIWLVVLEWTVTRR